MEWIDKQIKALQKVGKDARKSKKRAKAFIRSIHPKNNKLMKKEVKKCFNCKFRHRTEGFKIGKLTHYHCQSPTYQNLIDSGVIPSPWETIRVFGDSCNEHESNKVTQQ